MKCYDNGKESKCITYLDANDLYGYAMSQCLPYGELKWLNEKAINRFDVYSIVEKSSIGYTLEVDLEYPDELNELYNDYPLAQEKL